MKTSKLLLVGAVALGFASMAQAQTVVRFTGSTAFRAAAHNAILHALGTTTPTGTVLSSGSYGYTGSSLGSASQAIFVGTLSGSPVIIETSWSGSEGGIQTTAQDGTGINVNYLADATGGLTAAGTSGLSAGSNAQIPDVTMADTYQSTSRFNSSASIIISGTAHTYAALVGANSGSSEGLVGVQPFVWLATIGGHISTSGTVTNMTAQLARALFTVSKVGAGGAMQLSMLTGINADSSFWAFPVGRNLDSGTRLSEFAEVGLGALKTPTQYQPKNGAAVVTGTGTTITDLVLWPAAVTNGINEAKGTSGYNSGGQLVGALGSDSSTMTTSKGTGGILIGYISSGDSPTATGAGARELTYEGVPYSLTGVREGQYTAWCYEHMYYRSGSPVAALADVIAVQMHDVDSPILLNSMNCSRLIDGSVVTHN